MEFQVHILQVSPTKEYNVYDYEIDIAFNREVNEKCFSDTEYPIPDLFTSMCELVVQMMTFGWILQ